MTEFQAGRIKSPQTRIQNAISILEQVAGSLAGQFSVEHLEAAEPWHDRFDCLKWAIVNEATVKEMIFWHRAQNGMDLFDPEETPAEPVPAPPAPSPLCSCGKPVFLLRDGSPAKECSDCMPF